ncbi:MAG: ComF family protein [Chloroflexi bacterium]|nr:ComF family protein [Chloroflexota bacterium]
MINVLPRVVKLKEAALDLLFPQRCVGCGSEGALLCRSCLGSLPRIMPPLCPMCGVPRLNSALCSNCAEWQANIDGIRSSFRFEGVIRQAIHQLKYNNLRALAMPLSKLLNDYLTANPVPGDVLVPVPLHGKRLRARGYNQSVLLARELGRLSGLAVAEDCLVRQRQTPPQARTASVEERRSNVTGAFACRDHRLKGMRVIVIDDVSTSGATLNACAAALKSYGASQVWGLTLAREI